MNIECLLQVGFGGDKSPRAVFSFQKRSPVREELGYVDGVEEILKQAFYKGVRVAPEEHTSILALPPAASQKLKVIVAMNLFEWLNVPALGLFDQCTLALYGIGKTAGIVVDSGHENTFISSVTEDQHDRAVRLPLGGIDVSKQIESLIGAKDAALKLSSTDIDAIKKKLCYVACEFEAENTVDKTLLTRK